MIRYICDNDKFITVNSELYIQVDMALKMTDKYSKLYSDKLITKDCIKEFSKYKILLVF